MLGNEVSPLDRLSIKFSMGQFIHISGNRFWSNVEDLKDLMYNEHGAIWNTDFDQITFKTEEELLKFQLQFL